MSSSSELQEPHCQAERSPYEKDASYYFVDLIIQVEDTLFRIPRHYLEQNSNVFADMFQIPLAKGVTADGSSDDHPLYLEGIAKSDFVPLLKVMFPTEMDERKETPPTTVLDDWRVVENKANGGFLGGTLGEVSSSWKEWASVLKLSAMYQMEGLEQMATERICTLATARGEWEEVLRLSTTWRLHEIRERAIEQLDRYSSDMTKVKLAMDCGVEKWLLAVYLKLVQRSKTISETEEETLGQKTTYKLFLARRRRLVGNLDYRSTQGLENAIRGDFKEEMEKANDSRDHYAIGASFSSSQRKNAAEALKRDQRFYFTNATFIVEDTLFRTPVLYFERHWERILPHTRSNVTQRSLIKFSEKKPLFLRGVKKTDFRQMLRVMFLPVNYQQGSTGISEGTYNGSQRVNSMTWRDWASVFLLSNMWDMEHIREKARRNISTLPANLEEWIAVLRLSTAWRLSENREKAIQSLDAYDIDAKVMIELAKDCKVPSMLLRGYNEFIRRPAEISVEEAEWLGWETTIRLLRIWDRYRSPAIQTYSADLRSAFSDEVNELKYVK